MLFLQVPKASVHYPTLAYSKLKKPFIHHIFGRQNALSQSFYIAFWNMWKLCKYYSSVCHASAYF